MKKFSPADFPTSPGVYIHKNERSEVIYVGKAKNLRRRVSQYFTKRDHDYKTSLLIKNIAFTNIIVTNSELEALLLENRLIKQHKPKYNIQLKDSAKYYYIRVTKEIFPRILVTRKITNKKDMFFGPYTSSVSDITKVCRDLFLLRSCSNPMPKRVCIYYDLKLCSAPCEKKISQEAYAAHVKEATKLIKTGDNRLREEFVSEMRSSSKELDFERALTYRKRIELLDRLAKRQIVDVASGDDADVIGIATVKNVSFVSMLKLKKGIILGKKDFRLMPSDNLLSEFLKAYYSRYPAPSEILVEADFDASIGDYISEVWKRRTKILVPIRGRKRELLALARKNAYTNFNLEDPTLIELKEVLGLDDVPNVIDCFDISNYGESVVVGACVQYRNKQPQKSNWRHYNIRGDFGQDDFRSMHEVIKRRYAKESLPDLIIIDGGIIQVDFAVKALEELGKQCAIVGLAKKEETLVFPEGNTLRLDRRKDASKLIIKIRDSVHNFAISHSRNRFRKRYKHSELDDITGIGERTKFRLLQAFGGLSTIKAASLDEISQVIGEAKARLVYDFFNVRH